MSSDTPTSLHSSADTEKHDLSASHPDSLRSKERVEAGDEVLIEEVALDQVDEHPRTKTKFGRYVRAATKKLARWGVEVNGIEPTPIEHRTDRRLYQFFFVWFASNANILTVSAGTVGPAFYGLGMRDSILTIVVVDIIACAFPSFFAVFGPKLGTRAMVQSRYSWGYYGAIVPSLLNALSMQGYLVVNIIVGGQTLAAASDRLDATLGIVIAALISLAVTFCGYRVLHWFEIFIWIPNVIAFITMLAVGGKHFAGGPVAGLAPATPAALISFGSALAVTVTAWSTITPDHGVYHDAKAPTWRLFTYAYIGFMLGSLPAHIVGALCASAAVPEWQAGLVGPNAVGGLTAAVLAPTGAFGKILLVLLALSVSSACAPTMYTVCTSCMTVSRALGRIPRWVYSIVSTAILIPLAIVGAARFFGTFVQVLSLIGYWLAPFCGIVIAEHVLFRRCSWAAYEPATDVPRRASRSVPALVAFVVSIAAIVPAMEQAWWTGPLARRGTGDLGLLMGLGVGALVYAYARALEVRWAGGISDGTHSLYTPTMLGSGRAA